MQAQGVQRGVKAKHEGAGREGVGREGTGRAGARRAGAGREGETYKRGACRRVVYL